MTQQMHDVSMLSDEEVTIEGETYELEKGDVVSLSFKTARNYVNQFGIAQFEGDKYPVRDEEYEDEVGPTGENVEVDPEDNPSHGAKEALEADEEEEEEPEEEPEPEEEEDEAEEESGDVDVNDLTVSEVEDEVEDVEDVEVLNGMLKYEQEGEDRKGAKQAIEARIEELEADDEEESEDEE